MRPPLTFFVAGVPKPAGSKRGFYIPSIKRVVITDANPNSKDWKTDVKHEAQRNYSGALWDCPIRLRLNFFIARPKSHLNKNGNLRPSAPLRPVGKPDVLKLARGVEDALTSVIWTDDSRIVEELLTKSYGPRPGVDIEIKECE